MTAELTGLRTVTATRSTRVRDALLIALTCSTGAVDAVSWLGLGKVFSAFMTGNLVFLGFEAGGAVGPSVPRVLASVAGFAAGASLGARIVAVEARHHASGVWPGRVTAALALALVAQAVFLGLWAAVGGTPSAGAGHLLVAVSALAMGLQTSAVFSLGVRAVFTTAATATLTAFMGDLTAWSTTRAERGRLAGVLGGLLVGSMAGAYAVAHARTWAPALPLAISGFVVVVAARHGRGA